MTADIAVQCFGMVLDGSAGRRHLAFNDHVGCHERRCAARLGQKPQRERCLRGL